jgi:methionyl-tRNA synthetase
MNLSGKRFPVTSRFSDDSDVLGCWNDVGSGANNTEQAESCSSLADAAELKDQACVLLQLAPDAPAMKKWR